MKTTERDGGSAALPRIHERCCEQVARDFDGAGPEACVTGIVDELLDHNPHYLEVAMRAARDLGEPERMLTGFAMFYRTLALGARECGSVLPRIAPATRDAVAALVAEFGEERFVLLATDMLREENPELLRMADGFAARQHDYLGTMKAFVLLYRMLSAQAVTDAVGRATPRG